MSSQGKAVQLLAETMAEIVGRDTEAYRDIVRAIESDAIMDMMLAQSSFDALPGEVRRKIAYRVEDLVREHAGE
jgi:hypothetical protein